MDQTDASGQADAATFQLGLALAGAISAGAYTAGVLMHKLKDHDPAYVISHVMYGRWRAFDREKRIKALAEADSKESRTIRSWSSVSSRTVDSAPNR